MLNQMNNNMEARFTIKLKIGDLIELNIPKRGHQLLRITRIDCSLTKEGKLVAYSGVSPLDFSSNPLEKLITSEYNIINSIEDCKEVTEYILMKYFLKDGQEISTTKVSHLATLDRAHHVTYYLQTGELHYLSKVGTWVLMSHADFVQKMRRELKIS